MTRKITKNKNGKLKMMTEEIDPKEAALEMAKSIRKMMEDRDKKARDAKRHLYDRLLVTVDKYRTANGVMSALSVVRDIAGDHRNMSLEEEVGWAKSIATSMSRIANNMATKVNGLDPENMDKLCDEFYDPDFSQGDGSAADMAEQLMVLQLCQSVGPDAEDISEFCKTADLEIDKAREELRKNCEKNDLDFLEICGEKEDLDDLCDSCGNSSCHNSGGKFIKQGQSAYDVCKDFAE